MELSPIPTSLSQEGAVTAQPHPSSSYLRLCVQRKGPAPSSIPESPPSREQDACHAAQAFLDRAGLRLKTFGRSLCQAGAARKSREVTLSFLLPLKLRTDTANSTSLGIPSASMTALWRRCSTNRVWSHGVRRAAEPGSPSHFFLLCSSPSEPVPLTAFLSNQTGI